MGWVGHIFSPTRSVTVSTSVSIIGNKGTPVSLLNKYKKPFFEVCATASIFFPSCVTVSNTGGDEGSLSQVSWWMYWKCHRRFPVLASRASKQSPKRLEPLRLPP